MSRYKINWQYILAPLESTATFSTRKQAEAELQKWKKSAREQGQRFRASIRKVKP